MKRMLAALLPLTLCGPAFAGSALRSAPIRVVPSIAAPGVFSGAPITALMGSPVPGAPNIMAPNILAPSIVAPRTAQVAPAPSAASVARLAQDIGRQQAAAGGDVLAAAPRIEAFFDGSARADGAAGAVDAYTGLSPPQGRPSLRPLESIKELRFGAYNVENLFQSVGKYVPDLSQPDKREKVAPEQAKPEWQLRGVAQAILESDLDIVSVEEVESRQALEEFNLKYLGGRYHALLIEGNDQRGIDIGFLVKKDIPFELEHRTNKDELWTDPEGSGQAQKLFSRDLPVLVVRAAGRAQPLFVYLGTHYKSKRGRSHNDPTSEKLRRAQVERTAEIIARLRGEFGKDVPLMLGGDFNGAVNEEATFDALKAGGAGLTDALDLAQPPLTALERVTHTYHPKDEPVRKSQMDAIFISQAMRALVGMAKVYRYKDADGKEKPIPDTYEERAKNPSDHFPLLLTIKFQPLLHP